MIDERWARVKALFQAAIDRPAAERDAFLSAETAGDPALRREVESMLAADAAEASFFDRLPAAGHAAHRGAVVGPWTSTDVVNERPILDPGHPVGSYAVIGLIGAGAMGDVYRSRDTKLNRDVALKVLPPLFAASPDRLARFRREALVLATLNHPNIAAIYGFEESADVQALVLELVEGATLADRIAQGPIPFDHVLPLARQIAEALEAAHERGIVHRDLKPSNITVRPDGIVKVLDFGIAKALEPDSAAGDHVTAPARAANTLEGLILGTAAYMSPEQAKGLAVDRRTDIWAFGCVLFEMLAGRPAFDGNTVTEVLAAVVRDDPDWTALPAEVPAGMQTLMQRCVKKDPRQRLQAIGDARIELDAVSEARRETVGSSARSAPGIRRGPSWLPWVALAAIAGGVVVWEALRPAALEDPLAGAIFTRFTDWAGTEAAAEISPDGQFVAFVADRDGEFDIFLSQVGSGVFQNLTTTVPRLQPSFFTFRKIGFSGDGTAIWFGLDTGPSMAQMIMPLIGGAARPFLDRNATAPSWSPDGARLTYFKNQDDDPVFVADRNGADARQVHSGMHNHNPVWSTDGEWIYFAHGVDPSEPMNLWRIRPTGESLEQLTEGGTNVNFLTALDPRTVLYVGRAEDRSGPWLWALDVERKQTRRVRTGLGQYISVSASRDGRRIVATVANPTVSLWRVPLLDREGEDRDVEPYPLATVRALAPRFAGPSLFYLSASGAGDGLWRVEGKQASELSKGGDGGLHEPAAVSRDGSRVAIVVRRGGKRQLLFVSGDGRSSRTLAPSLEILGAAGQGAADWSPDGTSIVTGARDEQGPGLFTIPLDGGPPRRLITGPAANPVWSPDGNLIVYGGKFFTGQVELAGVRPDGTPVELPSVRTRPGGYRFLPDGSGLVYQRFMPALDFWLFDFARQTHRQLTRLGYHGAIGTFDITPDGKAIVFDRTLQNSDIVLIDLQK